jgi:type II secretory ATPase GspE/PulE/Tfp pilus assembly ATPase PilB-like protein
VDWEKLDKQFRRPVGCPKCGQTGYRGRLMLCELMEVSHEINSALQRGAPTEEIRAIAVGQGMTSMAADAVRRAAAGLTSLHEVLRVLGLR